MKVLFNRNPLSTAGVIEPPSADLVRNTLGLVNASPEDAIRYGGELTRAALSAMKLRNDRKYIVVDTKVHMLMPGFWPAIPGWHTDGVPRPIDNLPNISMQELMRPTHFHLLVTGVGCLTEFYTPTVELEVPDLPSKDLYARITSQVNELCKQGSGIWQPASCEVVEWDWWNLHRGKVATAHEWRFLIRVAESDLQAPQTDLRKVIRTQQQIYAPAEFGW